MSGSESPPTAWPGNRDTGRNTAHFFKWHGNFSIYREEVNVSDDGHEVWRTLRILLNVIFTAN